MLTRDVSVREFYAEVERRERAGVADLRRRFGNIPLNAAERARQAARNRAVRRLVAWSGK